MKKRGIFYIVALACALWLFGYTSQASAYSSFFTTYCTGCHGTNAVATCAGCHSHGTHPDSSKSSINITGTTNKTSYQPGETMSVTINGGYRSGWVRAILYDQNMKELARSTGTVIAGAIAPSGAASFPVTLQGAAPATPGNYTYNVAWYGNKFDLTDAGAGTTFFGPRWTPDPNNPNHGQEIVATNSFTVVSTTPPPAPAISVTDSVAPATDLSVPFGSVNAGSSATQTVTVTNSGTANLLVGAVGSTNPLAAPFSVTNDTCSNQTIAPAASCTITVSFAPVSVAAFTDSFNIPSNDAAKPSVTVNVSGTGAAVPVPAISVTDSVAPATDLSVPFGSVNAGSSASQTVTVTNTGSANLVVGAVGSTNPLAAPFSITNDTCSNQTIAPAAACTIKIAFAPTATGTFTDSFNIPSNDTAKASVAVNVSGTGAAVAVPAITVTDSVAPTTDLSVPFGSIIIGASASQTVTVTNTGTANLIMGAVGSSNPLAAPFSITNDTCSNQTIAPAAACTITVGFAPTSTGSVSDSFNIPSNDTAKPSVMVNVSGTGSTAPAPAITVTDSVSPNNDLMVPFGTVSAGGSAAQTVTITNSGNAALVIGTVGSADPLAAPFSITNDTCSNQTVAPAASCTLTISFAPAAAGTFTDSFNIPSNDTAKPSVTVNVSGTGSTTAALGKITVTDSVSPANDLQIPFGTVSSGRSVNQTVTVANTGSGDLVIGAVASANPLAAPFSIANDTCSGKTLAGGSSCTLTVTFAPTAIGTYSDSFDIPSNDPDQPSITLQVNGFGVSSNSNNPPGKPRLRHPADYEKDLETSLDMEWDGVTDPDGDHVSYELRISTDSQFHSPVIVAHTDGHAVGETSGTLFAGTGFGFIFFGVVFAGTARGRKVLLVLGAVVILAGSTLVGCSVGKVSTSTTGGTVSQHVAGLQNTTTYYWKVVASDGNGGVTESDVSTFTTK